MDIMADTVDVDFCRPITLLSHLIYPSVLLSIELILMLEYAIKFL